MANLVQANIYNIQPKLSNTGQMEIVDANLVKTIPPARVITMDTLSNTLRTAWNLPQIYSKMIVNEGEIEKEYYTSQTVAQLITAAG